MESLNALDEFRTRIRANWLMRYYAPKQVQFFYGVIRIALHKETHCSL